MATSLFGWDLLYNSVKDDIKNKQDILVCLTHLVLISNGFKCVGVGESKTLTGSEVKSESLPEGWNNEYALRYVYQGRLYNLKVSNVDDGILINLIRVDERTVGTVQFNVRQVVQRTGTLDELIPDHKNIVERIREDLINKVVVSSKSKNMSCQTDPPSTSKQSGPDPLYEPPRVPGGSAPIPPRPLAPLNPYDYGRSDLDPFGIDPLRVGPRIGGGVGGGGMLFQPPSGGIPGLGPNPGIAPGSLPPGARFDPFRPPEGPPRPRGPQRPDNDDFPPPGYDDMFM